MSNDKNKQKVHVIFKKKFVNFQNLFKIQFCWEANF